MICAARKLVFLIALLARVSSAFGSVEREAKDVLNVQLGVRNSSLSTTIGPPSVVVARKELSYEPNLAGDSNISFGYRNLGFGLSAQSRPKETEAKGLSSTQNYSFRFLGKNSIEASYQKVKGFHLKNSLDEFGTGFLQKPNMKIERTSLQWIYNFHDKDISLPALFDYSGRQKSSGWGFLAFINTNRTETRDETSLVPDSLVASYTEFADVLGVDRTSLGVGLGLAGALAYESFQMGALLTLGTAADQVQFNKTNGTDQKQTDSSTTANLFLNLGYNGKKNQLGVSLFFNTNTISKNIEKLDQARSEIRLFYGYRFSGVNLGSIPNGISSWFD